jgi:hypothetical protein
VARFTVGLAHPFRSEFLGPLDRTIHGPLPSLVDYTIVQLGPRLKVYDAINELLRELHKKGCALAIVTKSPDMVPKDLLLRTGGHRTYAEMAAQRDSRTRVAKNVTLGHARSSAGIRISGLVPDIEPASQPYPEVKCLSCINPQTTRRGVVFIPYSCGCL